MWLCGCVVNVVSVDEFVRLCGCGVCCVSVVVWLCECCECG